MERSKLRKYVLSQFIVDKGQKGEQATKAYNKPKRLC